MQLDLDAELEAIRSARQKAQNTYIQVQQEMLRLEGAERLVAKFVAMRDQAEAEASVKQKNRLALDDEDQDGVTGPADVLVGAGGNGTR